MQSEQVIAKGIAIGRVAYGVACIVAPRPMLGPSGAEAGGSSVMMARFFGVRDLVLGGGTFRALQRDPEAAVSWVEWSAAADALDVVVGIASRQDLDQAGRVGIGAIALPAALGGAWAARRLRAAL
ncbi:MAG: hypothetical protein ACTHN0_17680 [Aquihabitans sp.]